MNSISTFIRGPALSKSRKVGRRRSRPALESLEGRQVLSAFAPYVGAWSGPDLVSLSNASGVKQFTLAFIQADSNNLPSWGPDPSQELGSSFDQALQASVSNLRAAGGDVMVSFGGYAADHNGDELAQRISDVNALERAYQSVVDTYGLSQIDLDIEDNAVQDPASIDRRSQAIAQLQAAEAAQGRNLRVWLTLPGPPTGLDSNGAYVVNSAINAGITNLGVNLMTMDYGSPASPDQMASYAEQAAMSVSQQFSISPSNIGVTPLIGVQDPPDSTDETFDLTSASTVASWAQNWGLGRISMWSIDRDHPYGDPSQDTGSGISQQDYQFSQTFLSGGGGTNPVTGSLVLNPGQSITSPNGQFALTFQTDGNLVEYSPAGQPLWASGTTNEGAVEAVFQTDGNLVVYGTPNPDGSERPLWASGTGGNPGATLHVQDDGNIVIYQGSTPLWETNTLTGSPVLLPGQSITSPNGQFVLTFQTDGNLVEYSPAGQPLWASGTTNEGAVEAVFQTDGNLVVYGTPNPDGSERPLWASGTGGNPGATLHVQDDGNIVIYQGSTPLWETNTLTGSPVLLPGQSITSPNGQFVLTFQTDGNLVEYDAANQTLWASNTGGEGAVEAILQTDGNLVVYGTPNPDGSERPLWASGTGGNPGATLQLQDDGNVVIYQGNTPLWATNT